MKDYAEQKLSGWRDGEVRDLEKEMMELTLAIVLKALFHVDLDLDVREISSAVEWISRVSLGRIILDGQLPHRLPTPDKLRLKKFVHRLDKSIYEIIRRRRESGDERDDFLGTLLRTNEAGRLRLTDRDIRDEVLTFILAGHGTTAVALTWTLYLLSLHLRAESRLAAELETVLAGRAPNFQDLTALPNANQIMTESLRLYPPAWILTRDATRDCELGGYRITSQTTILICPWVTHRDPRFFTNPEEFIPERWADGEPKKVHPYAYIPFGRGPRFCIGSSFAPLEATLLLAIVAQRFRLRMPSEGRRPAPLAALTLRPKTGLSMVLARK
jgi:cytochrome P450